MIWDVFISHASEDKAEVARPLADALRSHGVSVWLDENELQIGDSLRRKIDEGLAKSRFGIVVLSPSFFSKRWPQEELDGLFSREADGKKVLLPIWYRTTRSEVENHSPILAGRLAARFESGLSDTVSAILQAIGSSVRTSGIGFTVTDNLSMILRRRLVATFDSGKGIYQGYFGGADTAKESKRWQLPRGGEVSDSTFVPKLPYYDTYWGYEAAFRIASDYISNWSPITLAAISRHFGRERWLRVIREYSFSDGPLRAPCMDKSIRHTARAAELIHLLSPKDKRVSQVAWELLDAAPKFQHEDGGWSEFQGHVQPSSLWSTIYVYRFLSKLTKSDRILIDERDLFLDKVRPILSKIEQFLVKHWCDNRWIPNPAVSWDEGAAAVLCEIGPFYSEETLIREIYSALRATLTPTGRLKEAQHPPNAPLETSRALKLAFGLKSAGFGLSENDSRLKNLVAWLSTAIDADILSPHEIACAVFVMSIGDQVSG